MPSRLLTEVWCSFGKDLLARGCTKKLFLPIQFLTDPVSGAQATMHAEMDAINKVNASLPDEGKGTAYNRQVLLTMPWIPLMHAETC